MLSYYVLRSWFDMSCIYHSCSYKDNFHVLIMSQYLVSYKKTCEYRAVIDSSGVLGSDSSQEGCEPCSRINILLCSFPGQK